VILWREWEIPRTSLCCSNKGFTWPVNSYSLPSLLGRIDTMPPSLALFLWLILLMALLRLDPAKESATSPALWVPVAWMFVLGTRLPSQWLGGQVGQVAQALEEGNPLDASFNSLLILLAIGILMSRSFKWGDFLVRNVALMAFLFFALVSFVWSDFPFVSLKRWIRDLGNYLMVLVVLSDPRPLEAVRTLLRRLCYLLIPLSIVLIKYYPEISRHYEVWSGAFSEAGPTTSKNMLGVACLISGLFFFWDTVTRWSERKERRTRRIIRLNFAFLAMTLWVLNSANSTTSSVCLVLGCLVIAAAHSNVFHLHATLLKVLIPASFCLYLVLALGFGMNGDLAGAVGKDPTLTDRTKIWEFLLSMHTNPLLGVGYESFWLGPRLQLFWERSGVGRLNEAHNGYLEVYLNLGTIGLFLLGGFLMASYRTACKRLTLFSNLASLALAMWTVMLFYSVTEAGFRSGLLWVTFLLGAVAVPGFAEDRSESAAASDYASARSAFPAFEATSQWR
jgi:exopolysaccharide production protein ExoQ